MIATMKFASCCRMWRKKTSIVNWSAIHLYSGSDGFQSWMQNNVGYTIPLFIVLCFRYTIGMQFFSRLLSLILESIWIETRKKSSSYEHGSCVQAIVYQNNCVHNCLFFATHFLTNFSVVLKHFDNCLLVEHSWSVHHSWRKKMNKNNRADCIVEQATKRANIQHVMKK